MAHLYLRNKIKQPYWQAVFAFYTTIIFSVLAIIFFVLHHCIVGSFFSASSIFLFALYIWHNISKNSAIKQRQMDEEEKALVI